MNRVRWLILILGPLPIVGSSWAICTWLGPVAGAVAVRNDVSPRPWWESLAGDEEPANAPAGGDEAEASGELARACQKTAARLENQLGPGCSVIARPPFVIGGDLSPAELDERYGETIQPAAAAMQRRYFRTAPTQPVTVLLFRGEQGYNRYAQQLFGESGISIYGYYKPNVRTFLLNLETGTGTLLHELTHALVDFDFPAAPDWLNEGLASLHEQCRFRGADDGLWLEGLVNWRLAGLKTVIRQKKLRSLKALVEDADFRGRQEGTNYAQARYFCLYLQQRGQLESLYHAFRRDQQRDPRGLETIAGLFADRTWQELDLDFQRWVLELEEPR